MMIMMISRFMFHRFAQQLVSLFLDRTTIYHFFIQQTNNKDERVDTWQMAHGTISRGLKTKKDRARTVHQ